MSAAGATPQAQLMTLGATQQQQQQQSTPATTVAGVVPPSAAAAAVANAAAAAQTAGAATPGMTLPPNFAAMGLPLGMPGAFPFGAQQFLQQAAAASAANAATTPGKSSKKQKGASGAPVVPSSASSAATSPLTPAQLQHFQQQISQGANLPMGPYGNFLHNYAMAGAAGTHGAAGDSAPRGRWSEEMTFRLIELRTKMDGRFRTVARPDKLWFEITTAICTEFGATLPRQSTKDKWKNLRSSFRLINQNKHPSHYTKETWPFYSMLERYVELKAEFDKHPDAPALPTLQLMDTSAQETAKIEDSDDAGEDEEDEDDGDGGEDEAGGDLKAKGERRGKKRDRSATRGGAGGAYFMPQDLVNALKPKDVTRKERDWAATVRSLNSHMVSRIQESHQALMQLTRNYAEVADRIAPSSAVRRHRADAATQHALRMQELSMEVEVVRAEPKHLPLLVQLFDQYRTFYQQHSDLERATQFLAERLTKNQSAIFIALPVLDAAGAPVGSPLPAAPRAIPAASGVEPSLTDEENHVANSLTSTLSVVAGTSSTTIGNAQRSSGRLPEFAYGFAQLYPSFSSVRLGRQWIVNDLFVHSSVRQRGIGSLLLTHVKKFAQDTGAVGLELSTQSTNLTAQKLYSRLDWRKDQDNIVFTQKL